MNEDVGAEDLGIEPEIYRLPENTVRPGDIVRFSPSFRPLKVIEHIGPESNNKGMRAARILSAADASKAIKAGADTKLITPGRLAWGLLLTRGCDIDKGAERQVVILRRLTEYNVVHHAPIIDGQSIGAHYLPAPSIGGTDLGESVLDFRFIITVHRDLFDTFARPISLTREALLDVYFGWMRHAIGQHIPDVAACPGCGTEVPIFRALEDAAAPPADY